MKRAPAVIAIAVVVAAILFWWWPGIRGDGHSVGVEAGRDDVAVVGSGEIIRGADVVARRLREEGYTVGEPVPTNDWCGFVERLPSIDPREAVVVHQPTAGGDCGSAIRIADDVMAALGDGIDLVVVVGLVEGDRTTVVDSLAEAGARIVDASTLLADVDGAAGCLWWDDCLAASDGSGYVVVRDGDGLTVAGHQRMARMIVAAVQS